MRLRLFRRPGFGLVVLLLVAGTAMAVEAVRTSTTFDEIVLVAIGARALETGDWSMVLDQPPLMPALFGMSARLADPAYPPEPPEGLSYDDRWDYARDLYFGVGNDPVRLALPPRIVAMTLALGLVVLAFAYGSWIGGPRVALGAAGLAAFLPDVLAHGAIAYNDVPLALAYLAALWSLDGAVRKPSAARGALAGAFLGLAAAVKYSAVALGPVALVLVGLEAADKWRDRSWWCGLGLAGGGALVVGYATTVVLFRGDFWLVWLEQGLRFTARHAELGHPAPAFLFGRTSPDGWWYFFPVAFLLKTPAALQVLGVPAAVGLLRGRGRGWWASRLRGPAVGLMVFLAFLLRANLNVGTRYALPACVPLLLLVAAGVDRFLRRSGGRGRAVVAGLGLLYAASTLSAFPWFLSFESEWVRGRAPARAALVDSSVDWGQGLLALRDFQEREDTGPVRLSYFGSALPEGYGIRYEALPSFLTLDPPLPPPGSRPAYTVISLTNLHGVYLGGRDPFASYRDRVPDRVLAGSLLVYREEPGAR